MRTFAILFSTTLYILVNIQYPTLEVKAAKPLCPPVVSGIVVWSQPNGLCQNVVFLVHRKIRKFNQNPFRGS